MKLISVITPSYNEELNIPEVYQQVKDIFAKYPQYNYEHIFIDNSSTDRSVAVLREIAAKDSRVKVIVNARNFGGVRSQFYGMLQSSGDATIYLAGDLQDPPELIEKFIHHWEEGFKIVIGVKPKSQENRFMFAIRKFCYSLIRRFSDVEIIKNFTGFGLYDKVVIDNLRKMDDRYPFFRGMIAEMGYKVTKVDFVQPKRKHGKTSTNFYTLYDYGMLAITSHTKVPLRLATMAGFFLSLLSLSIGVIYFILKIIFWQYFPLGVAPILIGLFFFTSIQLFFIGLLGEYVLSIHTQVFKRPLVVEEERINF
ncbi:MAG: glycosyltransferase family 2 protein [Pseudomonadota bacterium]